MGSFFSDIGASGAGLFGPISTPPGGPPGGSPPGLGTAPGLQGKSAADLSSLTRLLNVRGQFSRGGRRRKRRNGDFFSSEDVAPQQTIGFGLGEE